MMLSQSLNPEYILQFAIEKVFFYVEGVIHKVIVDQVVTSTDGKIETIIQIFESQQTC